MTTLRRFCLALIWLPLCAFAQESAIRFDIPAQSMAEALRLFASQAKMQLIYKPESVGQVTSNAVVGEFDSRTALERLLRDKGLEVVFLGENAATIRPNQSAVRGGNAAQASQAAQRMQIAQSGKTAFSPRNGAGSGSSSPSEGEGRDEDKKDSIAEIIVTAQKKGAERLRDVPVPVTAIGGDTLVNSNQLRLQDYFTRVPGLNVSYDGIRGGLPTLAIRGLRTSATENPTVGVVVDDLPYGSSTAIGGGLWVPEIDPSDIARIEVLRGPQGTLYGAGSLGGQMRFVTVAPSTDRLGGRVQVGTNSVAGGGSLGYSARGAVNVPVNDVFAIRASGFTRRDPGYIDNIQSGQDDVNRTDVYGGRASALWRPAENFSLRLDALKQDFRAQGSSHVYPSLGDLVQPALRDSGWLNTAAEVYSATIEARLAGAEIASVSGYSVKSMRDGIDSPTFSGFAQQFFSAAGAVNFEDNDTDKFSQEIRLSMPLGSRFDWLVGVFYTDEKSHLEQHIFAANATSGAPVGQIAEQITPTTFKEKAAFTDLTWKVTDRFDVQIGGRYSDIEQTRRDETGGPLFGGRTVGPELRSEGTPFTYLLTPRLRLSGGLMAYARFASGYRAGGTNGGAAVLLGNAPGEFKPDKTRNYELGIKGDAFDRMLSFDASVYYIDWQDLQLSLIAANAGYIDNAGAARSRGIELSAEIHPIRAMTVAAWAAWNDAALADNFPLGSSVRGFDGDRLPFSARWSGNLSIDQEFPLSSGVSGFVGAAVSYLDSRKGLFTGPSMSSPLPSLPRQDYSPFTTANVRAGVRYDAWTLDLFVNNVTDKRGLLSGGLGNSRSTAFSVIQPRTAGLSITRQF